MTYKITAKYINSTKYIMLITSCAACGYRELRRDVIL